MFFGKILKQGERYQFNAQNADEFQGEVLSITNAVLTPSSKESASLYINKDSKEYLIAYLSKESPQISLNIFISLLDELEIYVKGNAAVHITGFFEPEKDEDYEESEEEAGNEALKAIPGKIQTVKAAETKLTAPQKKVEDHVVSKTIQPKPQSPQQKPQAPQPKSPQQKPQQPQQKPQSPQQKPQPAVEVKKIITSPKSKQIVAPVQAYQESDQEDFVLDQREEDIDDSIDQENNDSLKKKQKKDNQVHKAAAVEQKSEQKGLKITNLEEKKNNLAEVKKLNGNEQKHQNVPNPQNNQHLSKKQLKKLKKEMKNKQQQ